MKKLPPIEKIYEAWSAIADGRVVPVESDDATVQKYAVESSDHQRTYTIVFDPKTDKYSSNDNSTYWRGYPGYPVIAVMMLQGRLPLDREWADLWTDINWNALNKQYRSDYAAAVRHAEQARGIDPLVADGEAHKVLDALQSLPSSTSRLKTAGAVSKE